MDMEKIKKQSEEIYDHLKAISHGNPGVTAACVEATGKIIQAQIIADLVKEMNEE